MMDFVFHNVYQKEKKAAEKLDEQVLSKLREFGLNDAESRSNIRDGNYTSQAYVLYNLILDYQQEEERRKKDELKKKSMSVKEILFGNRGRRDSAPVLPDFNFFSSSVEIKETKKTRFASNVDEMPIPLRNTSSLESTKNGNSSESTKNIESAPTSPISIKKREPKPNVQLSTSPIINLFKKQTNRSRSASINTNSRTLVKDFDDELN